MNTIYIGNALDKLKAIADGSVDCIVTSPPYWALRNYGMDEQIGMEETPDLFIKIMVDVFEEGRRILKDEGTLWLNMGDTYYGGKGVNGASVAYAGAENVLNSKALVATAPGTIRPNDRPIDGLKPKDLIGIPWMLAFALRNAGWYLRQDIIWSKPNPMPESVKDRCTKSHEYIFLLSKSKTYYFDQDAIRMPMKKSSELRLAQNIELQSGSGRVPGKTNGTMKAVVGGRKRDFSEMNDFDPMFRKSTNREYQPQLTANKRSVWEIATRPFSEAHFATFPEALPAYCIKAGCPQGGVVLDPFFGAGTTGLVASKLGRNFIGIELNPEYVEIAKRRLGNELGVFNNVTVIN